MLQHARSGQLVGPDFDRLGIALVLHCIVAEHGGQQLDRRQRAGRPWRRRALHVGGLLDQLQLVDQRLQAVGLFVGQVGELVCRLGELLLRQLLLDFVLDLGAHGVERLLVATANGVEADDVVAKVGLDDVADLARLHRKGRILERLDHRAAGEEIEVATSLRRRGIAGILPRHVGKRGRVLAQLGQQRLGLGLGLRAFGRRRVLGCVDQHVAGAALLGHRVARRILGVVLAQFFLGHA